MRNPAVPGGASTNATNGLDNATCSKIAAPLQAPTWRPIADIVGSLLQAITQRAIAYHHARANYNEADAIRQSARRAAVLS